MNKHNDKKKLKAFDLFSGIGGFRVGATSTAVKRIHDIEFVGFSEINEQAVRTYKANFNTENELYVSNIEDITLIDKNDRLSQINEDNFERIRKIRDSIPDFDILFAGFPCQSHSLMGNRKGMDDERGELFYSIREILKAKEPSYFVLENVRAIKSVNDGTFYNYITNCLENELGYSLHIMDLNSADYGVPQTRRRTFFVGIKKPLTFNIDIPTKVELDKQKFPTTWHLLEKEVDAKYFLSEKIKVTILADEMKGYRRKAEINKLIARPLTKTMHKMHRASQDNYYSLDFINGSYCKQSKSVVLNGTGAEQIRRLTPLEAFRLQGFSDNFLKNAVDIGVSDTQLYMQAGNAVTVTVVENVLVKLFQMLYDNVVYIDKERSGNLCRPIQVL